MKVKSGAFLAHLSNVSYGSGSGSGGDCAFSIRNVTVVVDVVVLAPSELVVSEVELVEVVELAFDPLKLF